MNFKCSVTRQTQSDKILSHDGQALVVQKRYELLCPVRSGAHFVAMKQRAVAMELQSKEDYLQLSDNTLMMD